MAQSGKRKIYLQQDVLTAARERMAFVFDAFESIAVGISGGKDSTVLAHLALSEAATRGRQIALYFVDAEMIHQATRDAVRYLMDLYPDNTRKLWLQVPYWLTENHAGIHGEPIIPWDPQREADWMRPREPDSIHEPFWESRGIRTVRHGMQREFERTFERTAFLIGLRADEHGQRYNAVTRSAGYRDVLWSTAAASGRGNVNFYPLYDWATSDVWRYIHDEGLAYNRIYDYQWMLGRQMRDMRIASLVNVHNAQSLTDLQRFEPRTYDRLLARVPGIELAALYGREGKLLKAAELPGRFPSWMAYRAYLLRTCPDERLRQRCEAQPPATEAEARYQCKRLLLNDKAGALTPPSKPKSRKDVVNKWRNLL